MLRRDAQDQTLTLDKILEAYNAPQATDDNYPVTHTRGNMLLDYLNDYELLQFRFVCRATYRFASGLTGSYQSKAEFIVANSNIYRIADKDSKQIQAAAHAYVAYETVLRSPSIKPALLYKLIEVHNGAITSLVLNSFADGEDLYQSGRRYNPGDNHNWDTNAAWVLAHIHKRSPFALMSELTGSNIMRTHGGKIYSALAKELAAIIKSHYQIGNIKTEHHKTLVYFIPPESYNNYRLTVHDLRPSNYDCDAAVILVHTSMNEYRAAPKAAGKLLMLFHEIEEDRTPVAKLQEIQNTLDKKLEKITSPLLKITGDAALKQFIRYYNEQCAIMDLSAPKLELDYSPTLFNASPSFITIVKKLREALLQNLSIQINIRQSDVTVASDDGDSTDNDESFFYLDPEESDSVEFSDNDNPDRDETFYTPSSLVNKKKSA